MKRVISLLALAIGELLSISATAGAQSSATVMLLHGIPGATVDVAVDGEVVIPGFEPGTMQDLSSFAGQTLTNVEVRAAGTTDVVIGPIASLAVPGVGQLDRRRPPRRGRHADAHAVRERRSALAAGQGRLTVRHTAAAPAVDVVLADGTRPFTNLSNPDEAAADLPAGEIAGAQVARRAATRSRRSRGSTLEPARISSCTPSAVSRTTRSRSTRRRSTASAATRPVFRPATA